MNGLLTKCCISKIIDGERESLNLINLLSIIANETKIASIDDLKNNSNTMYTGMGIFINSSIKLIRDNNTYAFLVDLKQRLIDIEHYEAIVELKLETL